MDVELDLLKIKKKINFLSSLQWTDLSEEIKRVPN